MTQQTTVKLPAFNGGVKPSASNVMAAQLLRGLLLDHGSFSVDEAAKLSAPELIALECGPRTDVAAYNPGTKAAGLFQFLPATWDALTVREPQVWEKKRVKRLTLSQLAAAGISWESATRRGVAGGPGDKFASLANQVEYSLEMVAALRTLSPAGEWDWRHAYVLHNQGVPHGKMVLSRPGTVVTNSVRQSKEALAVIRSVAA